MKRVLNLIIVDESGCMSIIEHQALMGLNETLETVGKMQELHPDMEQRVTLITFDDSHQRQRKSRIRHNACMVANCAMPKGSYYDEDDK